MRVHLVQRVRASNGKLGQTHERIPELVSQLKGESKKSDGGSER